MKINSLLVNLVVCSWILTACQSTSNPPALPVATPTDMPVPTNTPEPTSTPIPPTPTLPPPSMLLGSLSDVQILSVDQFNDINNWNTWNSQTANLADGIVEIQGQPNWEGGFVQTQKISEGMGIVVEFKNASGTEYEFATDTGAWDTDTFRSFGIYGGNIPKADLWQGKNNIGGNKLMGNLSLKKDAWYSLAIAIGRDGDFFAAIWDLKDPTHKAIYHEKLGEKWTGQTWDFLVQSDKGTIIYLDNFSIFSFSAVK
jgi:hypothetical protein